MIDHLLRFADEAAAQAALPQYWRAGTKDEPGSWDTSQCIPDTKVYRVVSTDSEGNETRDYVAGWFIQMGLTKEDQVLNKRAGATILDRESKTVTKVDSAVAAKSGWVISPVFAGR